MLLLVAAIIGGYLAVTYNALLGKWTAPADRNFSFNITNSSSTAKSIEFYRNRKFLSSGMMDRYAAECYGRYHFVGSNCVSLDIEGFRVKLANRILDVPVKDARLALLVTPQIWKLSDDGRMLEEAECFGDGGPQIFYKEPRR